MTLKEIMKNIKPASQALRRQAKRCWDQATKPLGSLGILEEDTIHVAAAFDSLAVNLHPRTIVVTCGDSGIAKEGVTRTGQEVTAIVAGSVAQEDSCVCLMARRTGADVVLVDVDMACRDTVPDVVSREMAYRTKDFLEVPTMIKEETAKAIGVGADMVVELKEGGYVLIGSREMGIGSTTTSSTLLSILLDMDPERVTGRGAGLTTAGYNREVQVMKGGIRIHRPSGKDPVDALSRVGGLDLAILTGLYIECAAYDLSVVLDGPITGAAALVATRVSPGVKEYLLASHVSAEPTGVVVLNALGLKPAASAGMCLGEGTGAAALLPLLDMAASVYTRASSSDEIHVDTYEHLV